MNPKLAERPGQGRSPEQEPGQQSSRSSGMSSSCSRNQSSKKRAKVSRGKSASRSRTISVEQEWGQEGWSEVAGSCGEKASSAIESELRLRPRQHLSCQSSACVSPGTNSPECVR
eukprot:3343388-Alexandrium_andersonii.AAC.1